MGACWDRISIRIQFLFQFIKKFERQKVFEFVRTTIDMVLGEVGSTNEIVFPQPVATHDFDGLSFSGGGESNFGLRGCF